MRRFPHLFLLSLALLYAFVNALKPITIDDAAYVCYARQAADRPLDPYGFAVYWWFFPEPAHQVLAPPFLAYWVAPTILLANDNPFLWKLSLFPFAFLLVYALFDLARRFARGHERPLVCMTILSPTFFPSLNLMLDVPAVALGLAALALFARAVDRDASERQRASGGRQSPEEPLASGGRQSPEEALASGGRQSPEEAPSGGLRPPLAEGSLSRSGLAALAGLLAGLGMQTKYTAVVVPLVLLLYALCFGGLRRWLVAALVAGQVFLTWEILMALLYGESHFLLHARASAGSSSVAKWHNFRYLIPLIGSVAWPAALLALAALGTRIRVVGYAALAGLLPYLLVACYGGDLQANENLFGPGTKATPRLLPFEQFVFGWYGLAILLLSACVVARLIRLQRLVTRRQQTAPSQRRGCLPWRTRPVPWFLVAWLLMELFGYLALTPFPAVRRVMGVVVAGTFAAGWLASLSCRTSVRRQLVLGISAFSAVFGVGISTIDLIDARAQKEAIERAAQYIHERDDEFTVWYAGHWGFQHYAERHGMRPIVAADLPAVQGIALPARSEFRTGDWIVLPESRIPQQAYLRDPERTERQITLLLEDRIPWRTVRSFYGGLTAVEPALGPRLQVELYRVSADHRADYLP